MKTSLLLSASAALITMALAGSPIRAEQAVASSADATSAGAAVAPLPAIPAEPVTFDHVVYLARLPSPAELQQGAKVQGSTIVRIDQTSDRLVVVYDYAGGRTVTFAYTLLSAAANYPTPSPGTVVAARPATPVVYAEVPASQVFYTQTERIYYPTRYRTYYEPAWDFWAPLTLGVGIGLIGGHGHGWSGGHGWHGGHGGRHR